MAQFVKLTKHTDGGDLLVNVNNIAAVDAKFTKDGEYSAVFLSSGAVFDVKESEQEIEGKIRG